MFAIIQTGGKQYKVSPDSTIRVEKLEAEVGSVVELDCVLADFDGNVKVAEEAKKVIVKAEIVKHGKDKKIVIFKYKPKKRVRTKMGHRQPYTELKIVSIG